VSNLCIFYCELKMQLSCQKFLVWCTKIITQSKQHCCTSTSCRGIISLSLRHILRPALEALDAWTTMLSSSTLIPLSRMLSCNIIEWHFTGMCNSFSEKNCWYGGKALKIQGCDWQDSLWNFYNCIYKSISMTKVKLYVYGEYTPHFG